MPIGEKVPDLGTQGCRQPQDQIYCLSGQTVVLSNISWCVFIWFGVLCVFYSEFWITDASGMKCIIRSSLMFCSAAQWCATVTQTKCQRKSSVTRVLSTHTHERTRSLACQCGNSHLKHRGLFLSCINWCVLVILLVFYQRCSAVAVVVLLCKC